MKKMILIFMILFSFSQVMAQSAAYSMFSDRRARKVGDIITILVVEYSTATSEASTVTDKTNDHGFTMYGGSGTQAFSPMNGMRGNFQNGYDGTASVSRKGQLQTKITATVTEIRPNGDLMLQGNRGVVMNGETETATITGVVRQEDVSGENTVYSYQLADAQISYSGKGVVNTGQRPGMITKLLNWVF